MKKFTLSTLVALMTVSVSLQAQVKETYKKNEMTTVVIKEDKASDMDILNGQFDLDEVGMHQVIRITTRKEAVPETVTKKAASTGQTVTEMNQEIVTPSTLQEPVLTASITEGTPELTLQQAETISVRTVAKSPAEKVEETTTPVNPEIITTSSKRPASANAEEYTSRRKSNKQTFAIFNKRFKKQKRKRVPRKSKRNKRCYKF